MSKRKAVAPVSEGSAFDVQVEITAAANTAGNELVKSPKKAKQEDSRGDYTRWEYYESGGWNTYKKKATEFLQLSAVNGDPQMVVEPTATYKKKSSEKRIRCHDCSSKLVFFIVKDKFYKKVKELNKN